MWIEVAHCLGISFIWLPPGTSCLVLRPFMSHEEMKKSSFIDFIHLFDLSKIGKYIPYSTRLSLRILLGTWLLIVIVLYNVYTTTLTSYMTVPRFKQIPNSLEELAVSINQQHRECKLTLELNSVIADILLVGPYVGFQTNL